MFEEFRRMALGPVLVAALVAALIAAVISYVAAFSEPYRSMVVSAAGAVGGLLGSALLQARARVEERRQAASVLATSLGALAPILKSDLRMISEPITSRDGSIPNQADLIAFAERAKRTCQQVFDCVAPGKSYSDEVNDDLAKLRVALDNFIPITDAAIASARTMPTTVEEYIIPLAVTYKNRDISERDLVALLTAVQSKLNAAAKGR